MEGDQDKGLYVITVAAGLAGLHPQTLRSYERKGLVGPSRTRWGSRRYSRGDIQRLGRIGELTVAGLNVESVKLVMELEDEVQRLRDEAARVRRETREAAERIHRQYRRDLVPVTSTGRRAS